MDHSIPIRRFKPRTDGKLAGDAPVQGDNSALQKAGQSAREFYHTVPPCPRCGGLDQRRAPGAGPHHASLRCASCNRFLKWLPRQKLPTLSQLKLLRAMGDDGPEPVTRQEASARIQQILRRKGGSRG